MLRPIAALGGGAAIDIGGPTPVREFQQFFDAEYPAHTMRYYWKSSFAEDLADDLIDHLVEAFGRRPSHHSTIDIWANGGAIARVSRDDSAFGQRTAPWLISPESNWESPTDDAANLGLGPGHRRRGRRQRLPELPRPPRGGRGAGADEPRRRRSTGSPRSSGPGIRTTCSASTPTSRRRPMA